MKVGIFKAVTNGIRLRPSDQFAVTLDAHDLKGASGNGQGKITQAAIAAVDKSQLVQTMAQLFDNLEAAGLLMLNATPVLHPARKPREEAKYWSEFLNQLLLLTAQQSSQRLTLILWGKVANLIATLPAGGAFDHLICEHPYNLSFIDNPEMQNLFAELRILGKHG